MYRKIALAIFALVLARVAIGVVSAQDLMVPGMTYSGQVTNTTSRGGEYTNFYSIDLNVGDELKLCAFDWDMGGGVGIWVHNGAEIYAEAEPEYVNDYYHTLLAVTAPYTGNYDITVFGRGENVNYELTAFINIQYDCGFDQPAQTQPVTTGLPEGIVLQGLWLSTEQYPADPVPMAIAFYGDGIVVPVYIEGYYRGTYRFVDGDTVQLDLTGWYVGPPANFSVELDFVRDGSRLYLNEVPFDLVSNLGQGLFDANTCPGGVSSRMMLGFMGHVSYTDGTATRLRSEPNTSSQVVMEMPEGTGFAVVGGPVCAEGYTWWQVQLKDYDLSGWAAEGSDGQYFIWPLPWPAEGYAVEPSPETVSIEPTLMLPLPSDEPLMCVAPEAEMGFSLVPTAYAFDPGQCTDHLDQIYPELIEVCLRDYPRDAHTWDDQFRRNCGFESTGEPQIGDIAVWEISSERPFGHVAYVEEVADGQVYVSEYNVTRDQRDLANRGIRPEDPSRDWYSTVGLKFIHIYDGLRNLAQSADATPLRAEGMRSYLITAPDSPLFTAEQGLFIYHDGTTWNGVLFDKINEDNGSLLFAVPSEWEQSHWGWENYYWLYAYVGQP